MVPSHFSEVEKHSPASDPEPGHFIMKNIISYLSHRGEKKKFGPFFLPGPHDGQGDDCGSSEPLRRQSARFSSGTSG